MTSADEYLADVRRSMAGMDPRVREDILMELRSHLTEASAANGGDVAAAITQMGSPARVGRGYRGVYGYGRGFQLLFATIAGGLAILTAPVLMGAQEAATGIAFFVPNLLAIPALVALVGWLLWVSVRAGSRAGLLAGIAAGTARVLVVLALLMTSAVITSDGLAVLLVSSALLVLVGWLPGTAKQAWSRPGADL